MLCTHRFPLPGSPSTCTLDTAMVPLPSFLLLVAMIILFRPSSRIIKTRGSQVASPRRWLHITYMVLLVCAIGMTILELARLAADHLGVGLLPIGPIVYGLVFAKLWSEKQWRTKRTSVVLATYWSLLSIFEAVKVARLHSLEIQDPTPGTKYPSSDQFLDNAVMLGLYVVFVGIELFTLTFSRWDDGSLTQSYKLAV